MAGCLAGVGLSLWFYPARAPTPRNGLVYLPPGAHSASCPILQWCGPTARGPGPSISVLPLPAPLWLGPVFTKFLSSVASPVAEDSLQTGFR